MKRFLISLCLLSSVLAQAQQVQIGPKITRPTVEGVQALSIDPVTGALRITPKIGTSKLVPVDTSQINGWSQAQLKLRQAIASGTGSGTVAIGISGTETLPAGQAAQVVNDGTPSAPQFRFKIPAGTPGTTGTKGDKGDPGVGVKGDPGNTGPGATIQFRNVYTGAAGTPASLTNVGTATAAVYDIVIPEGKQGAPGSATGTVTQVNGVAPSNGSINIDADKVPAGQTNKYATPETIRAVGDNAYPIKSENTAALLLKTDILSAAQLRATGTIAQYVNLTDAGKQGTFYYDPTDTTTPDDGGATCIVSSGKRYKFYFTGPLEANRFGNLGTGADDVTAISTALATYPEITLKPGKTYWISRLLIPNTKRLIIPLGATIKYLPLTAAQINSYGLEYGGIELGDGAALGGRGRIDGNKANRSQGYGIFAANTVGGAIIEGITVFNMAGDNIRMQHVDGGVTIRDVTTYGGNDRGLHIITTSDVTIDNYRHSGGTHGVQGWGDDTRFCERWTITNSKVSDGSGAGFWVYKARGWTVTASSAERFGDINFDFEKVLSSTFTNVYGRNGHNAGVGIYNGCRDLTFNNLILEQEEGSGSGVRFFLPNDGTTTKNTRIAINGGSIVCAPGIQPIYSDSFDPASNPNGYAVAEDVSLIGVSMVGYNMQLTDVNRAIVKNCIIRTAAPHAIWLLGGNGAVVDNNELIYTGSDPANASEIRMTWRSSTYSASGALINNNHETGFSGGIWDDDLGSGNASSGSIIIANRTGAKVRQPSGNANYSLRIAGNYKADGSLVDMGYRQDLSQATTTTGGYIPFLTLPPSSGSSLDNAVVGVTLGGWAGNSKKHYTLRVGQRDGLVISNFCQGDNSAPGSVVAYRQADNSTIFYASVGTFTQVGVDYRQLVQAMGVTALIIQTATPTGTKVYDSGTTPPNFEVTQSGIKVNGTAVSTGGGSSSGDMLKSVYDTDGNNKVDDADKFGGQAPGFYATATAVNGKEPAVTAGTTLQYYRGDKTWQTLPIYDGSETKVVQGANVSVTGAGTTASPYSISVTAPSYLLTYTTISASTYTLTASDVVGNKVLLFSAACTVTVPTGLSVGGNVVLQQTGSGVVTIAAGSGVTLGKYPSSQSATSAQFGMIGLHLPASNTAHASFN